MSGGLSLELKSRGKWKFVAYIEAGMQITCMSHVDRFARGVRLYDWRLVTFSRRVAWTYDEHQGWTGKNPRQRPEAIPCE